MDGAVRASVPSVAIGTDRTSLAGRSSTIGLALSRVNVTAAVVAGFDTYGLELDTPADH